MKSTILLKIALFILVISGISCTGEWRNFSLESAKYFAVKADVKGKVKIKGDSVHFLIQSAHLSIPPGAKKPNHISGIQIGLAYEYKTDAWDYVGLAPVIPISAIIPITGKYSLKPFKVEMNLENKVNLKNSWVILKMIMVDENGKFLGHTYAHEPNTPTQ